MVGTYAWDILRRERRETGVVADIARRII